MLANRVCTAIALCSLASRLSIALQFLLEQVALPRMELDGETSGVRVRSIVGIGPQAIWSLSCTLENRRHAADHLWAAAGDWNC